MKIIFESFEEMYNKIVDFSHMETLDIKFFCTKKSKEEYLDYYKEMVELTKSDNSKKLSCSSDDIKVPFFRELLYFNGIEIEVIND